MKKCTKKKLNQKRRKCSDCGRIFVNAGARGTHWKKVHYVPPPPPPAPPAEEHVSYADLVRGVKTWGRQMTKAAKQSPSREELLLGAVFVIIERLEAIEEELKRPKRLS